MGAFDKIVAAVSPRRACEREAWRQQLEILRGYDAAGYGRLNAGWRVHNESAEVTDRFSRDVVRARARDLERNSDIAQSTVSNYLSSIAVTHAPTKTSYFTGETFNSAGMVVTATMADGSKKTVTGYTCSPTTMAANTTAVTVSYSEGGVTKTTTTPVTVTSISNTLASNSWATIRAVSDAGKGSNYWSVGDAKGITINGKVGATTFSNLAISVFILGFNHNASREGSNRIHFQIGKINGTLVGLVDGNYQSHPANVPALQWRHSAHPASFQGSGWCHIPPQLFPHRNTHPGKPRWVCCHTAGG